MSMIITVQSLYEKIQESENIVVLDVRYDLNDEDAGRKVYEQDHIPGAVYVDLKKDLASPAETYGGENPLPAPEKLAKKLGSLSVDNEATVVIYDEDNKMFAARAWWTLYYIGLDNIYILDGGYNMWKQVGYDVCTDIPNPDPKVLRTKVRKDLFVNISDVKKKIAEKEAILIDSRAPDRYRGEVEPLYSKAGHIPGAVNYHYVNVYNEDGTWKNPKELQKVFETLPKSEEIIVSCGSGVSACSNVIGLKLAKFDNVKLYPGSFSDWISYEENEVVKNDE